MKFLFFLVGSHVIQFRGVCDHTFRTEVSEKNVLNVHKDDSIDTEQERHEDNLPAFGNMPQVQQSMKDELGCT